MENKQRNVAETYAAGEDDSRLKEAAKYFGIKNTRKALKPIRLQNPSQISKNNATPIADNNDHSRSILKFGSTFWENVGLIFSDTTLEAARMHSIGVMAKEERIAGDGTLHLMSVARRKKGTFGGGDKASYTDLMDLFQQKPLGPLEYELHDIEEEEDMEEIVVDSVEGGSIGAAIFGLIKGAVGPAVLYLPRGFNQAGYAVAIPSMMAATATYLYCANRLLECWKVESDKNLALAEKMEELRKLLDPEGSEIESSKQSYGAVEKVDPHLAMNDGTMLTYPELARRAFGTASVLISGGIAAMQFGVCLTYLIYVPQNLYECFRELFGIYVPKSFFLIGMLLLEIPLVWIRDIRKLTPFNVLATMLISFGLLSVLSIAIFGMEVPEGSTTLETFEERMINLPAINPTWFLFIGTSFFCFEGSITLLVPLQEAVYTKEDRQRFPRVNQIVMCCIVSFYIFFATICWTSFGSSVQTALTASLPKGILTTVVQLAYSVAVIFTFPLQAFPALEVVCQSIDTKVGQEAAILKRNIKATVIILLLGVIAVVAIDYLGNVVSLLGSLVGVPIALIYPPMIHNVLVNGSTCTKFMNYTVSLIGLIAAAAASYTTITSWDEGAEG